LILPARTIGPLSANTALIREPPTHIDSNQRISRL
jgi:hypothetical protein